MTPRGIYIVPHTPLYNAKTPPKIQNMTTPDTTPFKTTANFPANGVPFAPPNYFVQMQLICPSNLRVACEVCSHTKSRIRNQGPLTNPPALGCQHTAPSACFTAALLARSSFA